MLWIFASSTLLLAVALLLPAQPQTRRRILELTALLVTTLPLARLGLEAWGVAPGPLAAMESAAAGDSAMDAAPALLTRWVLGGWTLGLLLCALWSLRQWQAVRRLARHAQPLTAAQEGRVSAVLGLPRPQVARRFRTCAGLETPLVLPTHPSLVLLPQAWQAWPERLQASSLRHEWHHVLSRDPGWQSLLRVFCILFWFHPLAWRLAARWAEASEQLADKAAVGGGNPADYAQDLLGLASGMSHSPTWQGAMGFLGNGTSRLQRRVSALLSPTRRPSSPTGGMRSFVVVMLLLAGNCAWLGVRARQLPAAATQNEVYMRLSANPFPADM